MTELERIGYSGWFSLRADKEKLSLHEVARIVSVHKDSYLVSMGGEEIYAELSGHYHYAIESVLDLPTTGDWVYVDFYDDDSHAIIDGLLPRRTLLKRKTSGRQIDYQMIAANIDVAFVLSSYPQVTVIAFSDLVTDQAGHQHQNNTGSIIGLLKPGLTYCLLGSFGVGKTSLINTIIGRQAYVTQPVSKVQSKGRYTTTSRQLVRLDNGSMIIDTPGMRELGAISIDDGLDETFTDIVELSGACMFSDCSHTKEKGCAILAVVMAGDVSEQRYQNYLKMKKESAYHQMTYLDRKGREKRFGKMVKTVMKNKKR